MNADVSESTLRLVEEGLSQNHLSPILSLSYPGGYFVVVLALLSRGRKHKR